MELIPTAPPSLHPCIHFRSLLRHTTPHSASQTHKIDETRFQKVPFCCATCESYLLLKCRIAPVCKGITLYTYRNKDVKNGLYIVLNIKIFAYIRWHDKVQDIQFYFNLPLSYSILCEVSMPSLHRNINKQFLLLGKT